MKNICQLSFVLLLLLPVFSCSDKEAPDLIESDFFMEGIVDGKLLHYPQVDFDWTNVSNTYFTEYEQTWLQAYKDSTNLSAGYWKVRIHDINIENLTLPYQLGNSEGSIQWIDPSEDTIIANNPNCQGVDNGCQFVLPSDNNEILITSVEDDVIEGEFSGKLVITGTGSTPYSDAALFHTVTDGTFRIKYRKD